MPVLNEDFLGGAAATALASGIGAGNTSLTVAAGGLTTWTPVVFGRIAVIIDHGETNEERLYATAVSGDMLTGLIRGADGTTAQSHNPGAKVTQGLFASHVAQPNAFLSLPTAKGDLAVASAADTWAKQAAGADNTVLVYDAAQANGVKASATLAGLTLTAPTIADFTNAAHDHLDTDDAGLLTQAATHQSPDTDAATSSLHHTIGTGANQATPGTHPAVASGVHGVSGSVVGTTDAQTLTNKTLTAPTIADFTNAQHDHGDADDGGVLATAATPAALPQGILAYTKTQALVTTATLGAWSADIFSATVAAFHNDRRYRITALVFVHSSTIGDKVSLRATVTSTSPAQQEFVLLDEQTLHAAAANAGMVIGRSAIWTPNVLSPPGQVLANTVTVQVSHRAGSGTITADDDGGDANCYLLIEDAGGV